MKYKRVAVTKYGGPEVLSIVEEDGLPEPGDDQVRVRVLAVSASFTDTLVRKGLYPGIKAKPPALTPGYDLVGLVDKAGKNAGELRAGQKVAALTVYGSYTEYICLPASRLVPVPDEIDPAEAVSMVLSYLTAYQMLHRIAKVKKDDRILFHGAGGAVGTAIIQLGKLHDLEMYGTASKPKHELIKKEGAVPIDYRNEDFVERIRELAPDGVHAAFDPIGGDNFKRSFNCLRRGGILVAYGFYNAGTGRGGNIPVEFLKIHLWNLLPNGRSAKFYLIKNDSWLKPDLTELFSLLSRGKIQPVIEKRMPLEEAAKAHELIDRAEVKGKIILLTG